MGVFHETDLNHVYQGHRIIIYILYFVPHTIFILSSNMSLYILNLIPVNLYELNLS